MRGALMTAPLHWHAEPLNVLPGSFGEARARIPAFARIPFGSNPSLDVIACSSANHGRAGMPVGVVSKSYVLIQHAQVLDAALRAIESCGVDLADVDTEIALTASGARMAARFRMPGKFSLDPSDRHPTDLTFECFNSVDRSVPLSALVGWYRLVCSNGLVVGTTTSRFRQRHTPPLELDDFEAVLRDGLDAATGERSSVNTWKSTPFPADMLVPWIDGAVTRFWGALAAGRVYRIILTGYDGDPEQRFEKVKPHERTFTKETRVPGSPEQSETVFDVAQALSWVASHRNDFQQRLAWRNDIPALVAALTN